MDKLEFTMNAFEHSNETENVLLSMCDNSNGSLQDPVDGKSQVGNVTEPEVVTTTKKVIAFEMATEEHLNLVSKIRHLHQELRKDTQELGAKRAWEEHLKKEVELAEYAKDMEELDKIWDENASKEKSIARSRKDWILVFCDSYFFNEEQLCEKRRAKERRFVEVLLESNPDKILIVEETIQMPLNTIDVLDVGSCFNPFKNVEHFNVTAIDIKPANDSVYKGDFFEISVDTGFKYSDKGSTINTLPKSHFHCIIFSLLLEYLPLSEQRVACCEKAYELLKYEGILIIITPDSQHIGKNAKLMKNWRYTLAIMGFSRVKFEKLAHITCLVFRKSLTKDFSVKWANDEKQKEPYLDYKLHIPQDMKTCTS